MQKSINSSTPMSMSLMNVNAKPFFPENYQRDLELELKWYESKTDEFENMNKFIFEDEPELKFILSLENTSFKNVEGERFKEKPKFKPVLLPLKEITTWVDIVE
jgi:hypothetical protein